MKQIYQVGSRLLHDTEAEDFDYIVMKENHFSQGLKAMTTRKIGSSSGDPPPVISLNGASDEESDFFNRNGEMEIASLPKPPIARTLSSRSSQQTAVTLQPPGPAQTGLKSKKLGHRRVTEDGEVTYKKFETTQLIGSIQLGIHFSVGSQPGIPDRDILMEDFLFSETVSFTRDGLLQKTPAHRYSEFRFRTYAPYAFRFFRHLFEIETDLFLASLCSEAMVELANPGVSGSIFYVTRDDNFICKTVQHKEADFLQKLLPGYYLNLQQNPRTLLPKFFGFYCYSCNAKNVRLVIMNNLIPSGLRMQHKFDLKGSTCKRKASRRERAKSSPTYKDLDFMEMYPEGILLQAEIYENVMSSIKRDCRVLESFKIMDYSLLIGIHNVDQASKGKDVEFDGVSDLMGSDNESINTDKPSLDRQGSIQYRERMIAHSTALESITMEVNDPTAPRPSIVGTISIGADGELLDESDIPFEAGLDNVWGGIPARNHRGENLLLFIGIIDILQEYGVAKKMEHYWKSLIHDGDTVSVHRPSFYAKRFKQFMGEKVFRKMPLPLRTGPSMRRGNLKRAMSKETEVPEPDTSRVDSWFVTDPATRGVKESAVTVITIGETSGTEPTNLEDSDDTFLPPVLQDRKRAPSAPFVGGGMLSGRASIVDPIDAPVKLSNPKKMNPNRPDVVATCSAVANKLAASFNGDDHDTGSIITMTSDERVQIYVPSPLETTPYNTITRQVEQIRVSTATTWPSPTSTNITVNGESIGDDEAAINLTPFQVHRVSAAHSYRSLTPLNMDVSDGQATATKSANLPPHDDPKSLVSSSNETSLEMIKISLVSEETSVVTQETRIEETIREMEVHSVHQSSLSDQTLGPELPSLPTDKDESNVDEAPVSLSHIELIENPPDE